MEKLLKRDIKITSIFLIHKIHQNKHAKIAPIFESCVHWNDVNFPPMEITFSNVRWNNIWFSFIKITLKKVYQSHDDLSPIEITSKKYVKMTWNFVDILFPMYWLNIDIKSASIRSIISIGFACHNEEQPTYKYFIVNSQYKDNI